MKKLLILTILMIPLLSFAQKQGNIWYFGDHAGVSFNSGSPIPITDGQTYLCTFQSHNEGSSVISDSSGSLLCYCDGQEVWNKNHQIMPNGSGLLGSISSTQSCIIVPKPLSSRYFYIFTTDGFACGGGLGYGFRYSIVDICLDNSNGDIIEAEKNIKLLDSVCEKLTVTRHANGNDYWVLTHKFNSNEFWAFLFTANGITDTVISAIGSVHGNSAGFAIGQLKLSPNGNRIAIGAGNGLHLLELFDFDKSTGIVSNFKSLKYLNNNCATIYGVEFSPDNTKLYARGSTDSANLRNFLIQYNLNAGGGNIDSINASLDTTAYMSIGWANPKGLQIGPDDKIYMVSNSDYGYLSVINNPNNIGSSCNYQNMAIYLGGQEGNYSLPSFVAGYNYSNTIYKCDNGIDEQGISRSTISPNPFSTSTQMSFDKTYRNIALSLYDLQGKLLLHNHYSDCNKITLHRNQLSTGLYFLKLIIDDKQIETRKIVISD